MYDSMSKEQRVDILKLADFLDCLPSKNFSMRTLNPFYGEIGPKLNRKPLSFRTEIECGTACCVIGWAAITNKDRWDNGTFDRFYILSTQFSEFYGLSPVDTNQIGFAGYKLTPQEKAQEIRSIVRDNYIDWEVCDV